MMSEHSTKIELAGEPLAAIVIYERCPFDGHPIVCEVILSESKLEIVRALKEWQLANFEAQIEAATDAAITGNRIDQADLKRTFRSPHRRAA